MMAQWFLILSLQQRAAAAAGLRVVLHYLVNALNRQQLRAGSWMARLAAAFAATALATLLRLVARRASAQQYPGPSLEGGLEEFIVLLPESPNLLLLSEDQRSVAGWRRAHHKQSLPEMQLGIKLL